MYTRFSSEQKEFIRLNFKGRGITELTTLFNTRFGTMKKTYQINNQRQYLGLRSGLPKGVRPRVYTLQQIKFIKHNSKGRRTSELTLLFNLMFNTTITDNAMLQLKHRYGVTSGIKGWEGMLHPRYCLIGSERLTRDGYVKIKVSDGNWVHKNRLIWEKANGKIPKNHAIIFADGNKQNFSLDNLLLISKSEQTVMNCQGLITTNAELTKVGHRIAGLKIAISKSKRKLK